MRLPEAAVDQQAFRRAADARPPRLGVDHHPPRLFQSGRARDTLAIWVGFFLVMLATYTAFSWLPIA